MSAFDKMFATRIERIRKGIQSYNKPPIDSVKKDELLFIRKKGADKNGRK